MIKVSVIVAVWCPGEALDRVIRSCAAQTLPADEFEVLLVDDGSPDDTFEKLTALQRAQGNIHALRIDHTGWPSAPRNAGMDQAGGEYCLFMDHDDELFPDALRSAYTYASQHRADVLNAKEIRSDAPSWAWASFQHNDENVINRSRPHPLAPMNPHKLYRTKFLRDHAIRFVEGKRVLYEDRLFSIACLASAEVVSTLAETPFYHWVRSTSPTASTSYGSDREEFWDSIRLVLESAHNRLARKPELLQAILLDQYETSILGYFNDSFPGRAGTTKSIAFIRCRAMVDELIPLHLDRRLGPDQAVRAHLLRSGRSELLEQWCTLSPGWTGITTANACAWGDGRLDVRGTVRWSNAQGEPMALDEQGDDLVRVVPPDFAAAVPPELLRVADALERAETAFGVTDRDTRITWWLPTESELRLTRLDGQIRMSHRVRTAIDPGTAAFGEPLSDGVWDVNLRASGLGRTYQRGVRSNLPAAPAAVDGRAAIAYATKSKMLALDLGQRLRSLVGSGSFAIDAAHFEPTGDGFAFSLPMSNVATFGPVVIEAPVALSGEGPVEGQLATDREGRLTLTGTLRSGPGRFRLFSWVGARKIDTGVDVVVDGNNMTFATGDKTPG